VFFVKVRALAVCKEKHLAAIGIATRHKQVQVRTTTMIAQSRTVLAFVIAPMHVTRKSHFSLRFPFFFHIQSMPFDSIQGNIDRKSCLFQSILLAMFCSRIKSQSSLSPARSSIGKNGRNNFLIANVVFVHSSSSGSAQNKLKMSV